ncbi:MAG: HAD-IC family P-type ATPase [Planctomycetales bacterium]|nr:HAD-IC family P-type ATPase [Planctomycetales bacterium]
MSPSSLHDVPPNRRSYQQPAIRPQMTVRGFKSITGGGVCGVVDGTKVVIGNRAFLNDNGVGDLFTLEHRIDELQQQGRTVVYVAVEGTFAGVVAVADPIKESTPEAIKTLHDLGLRIIMLTGDNEKTARTVAEQLGIDEYIGGVRPEDKQERVKVLQADGHSVAMAGDGINDALALAEADVGNAMGTGTDVAIESAGVTLVKGDLLGIVKAVTLNRGTMRNIRQNLFFAFVYNALGVPIAARRSLSNHGPAAQSDDCRRRDEFQQCFGDRQRDAIENDSADDTLLRYRSISQGPLPDKCQLAATPSTQHADSRSATRCKKCNTAAGRQWNDCCIGGWKSSCFGFARTVRC